MNTFRAALPRIFSVINSERFFWVVVAIFVGQASWIALTGNYPMAFDEDFHLGLIRIYATHISPFLNSQPAHADALGAVARDPSYLYHYLMSFPFRFIELFTHDQTIQVIILRFINIALFASCLPLFRRLLKKSSASSLLINSCFIIFVLLPVVPLLAAQINYDNLFIPLTALTLLLALSLGEDLDKKHQLNLTTFLSLLSLALLTSLVKYAYLPLFLAIMVFVVWRLIATAKQQPLRSLISSGWRIIPKLRLALLLAALALSLLLFAQRYGINLVRYHELIPDCSQVLNIKQCSAYGPWNRDYDFAINKVASTHNPFTFTVDWLYGMWLRLFFAVDGPDTAYQTRGPLLLPSIGAIVLGGLGLGLLVAYGHRLWQRLNQPLLILCALSVIIYISSLWIDNYHSFVRTGQPVAINGRYLLPIMLPLLLLIALAYRQFLRQRPQLKIMATYATLLCFLLGGGALTYILRSNDDWYWPSPAVRHANHAVKKVVGPITPGNSRPTAFLK